MLTDLRASESSKLEIWAEKVFTSTAQLNTLQQAMMMNMQDNPRVPGKISHQVSPSQCAPKQTLLSIAISGGADVAGESKVSYLTAVQVKEIAAQLQSLNYEELAKKTVS